MKIAYDYQIFQAQCFGGISRYFFEVANHLAGLQSDLVDCRIISPIHVNQYLLHPISELKITGISVPFVPRTSQIYCSINRFMSQLAFRRWHPDIVHETYYSPKSVGPLDSRIVLTVYDMIHELYPESFSLKDRTREYKKIAVEKADHVICISENTRKDLIQLLGVAPEKTTVIHPGFGLNKYNLAGLPLQKRPFILYVGPRGGYKNFARMLSAYASRPELRDNYDIVAFGGGRLRSHEVEMIRRLHVSLDQVDQMSGNDGLLATLYKQAAMFVYPSLYEGFGIPPLEAMNLNCPVACSNTSSIPEVVGDAAILFEPHDIDSIADAMTRLALDSVLRNNLIECGRSRARKFSWDQCAMQTLDVYRALLQ